MAVRTARLDAAAAIPANGGLRPQGLLARRRGAEASTPRNPANPQKEWTRRSRISHFQNYGCFLSDAYVFPLGGRAKSLKPGTRCRLEETAAGWMPRLAKQARIVDRY